MLRRSYDWTLSLAQSPHALWALAVIAFVESSVFPIPPDVLMIPLILARPKRAFVIAGVGTLASVLGGLFGYYIGFALFETVGQPIVEFYGKGAAFADFAQKFNDYGAWAVLIAGVTPFPFKIVTIASGATHLSLPIFVVSSIIARGLRFFVVAVLLWRFGAPIRDFIERRLGPVFIAFCILLVGGFWVVTKI